MTLLLPAAVPGDHIHSGAYDIDGRVIRSTLTGVVIRYQTRSGRGASETIELEIPFSELEKWTIERVYIANKITIEPKPQKPINWVRRAKINEMKRHGFIDVDKITNTPKTLYIDPEKKIMEPEAIRKMVMNLDYERDQHEKAARLVALRQQRTMPEITGSAIEKVQRQQAAVTKRHNAVTYELVAQAPSGAAVKRFTAGGKMP